MKQPPSFPDDALGRHYFIFR